MVVSGMEAPGDKVSNSENAENVLSILATESGIDKNTIANNIDKIHPIGATLDNKQQRIVKFKSDRNKEKIYMTKKERKKRDKRRSCCPTQMIKSRIMIQSNLLQRYAWNIENSTTKSSKMQICLQLQYRNRT